MFNFRVYKNEALKSTDGAINFGKCWINHKISIRINQQKLWNSVPKYQTPKHMQAIGMQLLFWKGILDPVMSSQYPAKDRGNSVSV